MFGRSLEEKREHIAKIAVNVFFAKGYKESSLQDISIKGNISKAGIYHYFKTKEDILSHILFNYTEMGIKTLRETLEANKEKGLDDRQSVVEFIKTYATYLLKNRKNSLLVLRERHQLGEKNRKLLHQQERAIFLLFKNELKKVPNLNTGINLSLMSFEMISMIHWMGYWLKDNGDLTQAEAINQGIDIFFNGILNK